MSQCDSHWSHCPKKGRKGKTFEVHLKTVEIHRTQEDDQKQVKYVQLPTSGVGDSDLILALGTTKVDAQKIKQGNSCIDSQILPAWKI